MSLKTRLLSQFSCNRSRSRPRDVRQGEVAECGLAALASLMSAYGADVSLDRLRELAASTLYGTSLRTLREIAIRTGFEARARRVEAVTDLAGMAPCLVHLNFIHFAVVERVTADEVLLSDPLAGPMRMPIDRFSRAFTGIALTLRPTPFLRPGPRIAEPSRMRLLGGARMRLGIAASAGSGAALAAAAIAAGARIDGAAGLAPALAALTLAVLFAGLAIRWAADAVTKAAQAEQVASIDHVAAQPAAAFVLRAPQQAEALIAAPRALVDPVLIEALLAAAAGSAILVGAVIAVPLLGLAGAAMIGAEGAILAAFMLRRGAAVPHLRWRAMPVRAPGAGELLRADSWGLGRGCDALFQGLAGSHAASAEAIMPGAERGAVLAGIRAGFAGLRLLALILVGGALLDAGETLGVVFAGGALVMLAGSQLGRIAAGLRTHGVTTALHRLADRSPVEWGPAPASPPEGIELVLDAVSWRPAQMLGDVVSGITLAIPAAGSLAIVGPPRSGATTVARLAAGWLSPTRGTVAARAPMMLGTQWPYGAGRLRDLLCVGDSGEAAISEALKAIGLWDVIRQRGGLDLTLSEGAPELSGGQRRRLLLAAALLRQPALLVLDGTLEALGTASAAELLALFRARDIAVLLAGHRDDISALCDARYRLAGEQA